MTWSWQKVLGGEAQHGMLVLSPRAVERLESYKPAWPMPKIFRLTKDGKISEGIFKGETINTPSMIAVEDAIDGLKWAQSVGGLPGLIARSESNLAALGDWVAKTLDRLPSRRSRHPVLHVDLPADHRSRNHKRSIRRPRPMSPRRSRRCWRRKVSPMTPPHTATRPPACGSGGSHGRGSDIEALIPWIEWAFATGRRQ